MASVPKQGTTGDRWGFCDSFGSYRVRQSKHPCAVAPWGYWGGGGLRGSVFVDADSEMVSSDRPSARLGQNGDSAMASRLEMTSQPDRALIVPSRAFLVVIMVTPCFLCFAYISWHTKNGFWNKIGLYYGQHPEIAFNIDKSALPTYEESWHSDRIKNY